MHGTTNRRAPSLIILAVALTAVAGYVDAVGYLTLDRLYIANMSGNSVSLGMEAVRSNWPEVLRRGSTIASYFAGLLASRIIVTFAQRRQVRRMAWGVLAMEIGLLSAFSFRPVVFLAAFAMGLQTATLSRFNGVTVYTSFVTGTLVKVAENIALCFWWLRDRGRTRPSGGFFSQRCTRESVWFASVWGAYVLGAVLGTSALDRFGLGCLSLASIVLAGLIIVDIVLPAELESAEARQ
jgi:uncharacterized membrane protein YoaK (UPF0700 family)